MPRTFRRMLLAVALCLASLGAAAEPGVTDTTVLFGQSIGFDSVWGGLYRNYTSGLEAVFKMVNSQGGVHGRTLHIKRLEDNYVTEKAVANVRQFGESQEVFGLVCLGGTGITLAVMPLLEKHKLPTVGTMTGADGVRQFNRYLFHTRSGYSREVGKMVQHLATIGMNRIAVVYQDNAFGKGNLEAARRAAAEHRAEIVADIAHRTSGDDIESVLPKLAQARPQAMLLFTSPKSVADIIARYRQAYGNPPLPWMLSVTTPSIVHKALGDKAQGIAVTQVMPHPSAAAPKLVQEFRETMARHGDRDNMTYEALEGYLTGRVVVEALRRAGRNLTREGYVRALEGFGEQPFGGFFVTYGPKDHGGPTFVEVTYMRQDGTLVR